MKRGAFKKLTYKEALKKKQAKVPKKGSRGLKVAKQPNKEKSKGYEVPKWFKSLPLGSHGNTPAQKKYWKVVSDFVRQRDFIKYNGKCVSCDNYLEHWKDGDCAHWRAWSLCNGFMKFELKNLALSCKGCNRASDGVIGHKFGEELKRRHNKNILNWIMVENEKHRGEKMERWKLVELAQHLLPDVKE